MIPLSKQRLLEMLFLNSFGRREVNMNETKTIRQMRIYLI